MADWLRPVFGRAKPPAANIDRAGSFSLDDTESEDGNFGPRPRPASRVASYIGPRPMTPPFPRTPDSFATLRNPENVYHEPSGDQMAEMLKVVMMNQDSIASVPVEYNSCIMHVLEAYQNLRLELRTSKETIEDLRQSHTRDVEDFEAVATQWDLKEQDYKYELKKLEVLLSQTEGGLEKVTLARSKSTVHGSRRVGDTIGRGVGTVKERNEDRCSAGTGVSDRTILDHPSKNYRADRSLETRIRITTSNLSDQPSPKKLSGRASHGRTLGQRASSSSLELHTSLTELAQPEELLPDIPLSDLTITQIEVLERQKAYEEHGVTFNSSSSDTELSMNSYHERFSPVAIPHGLGIGLYEKPLPGIPTHPTPNMSIRESASPQHNRFSQDAEPMGFSIRAGDDSHARLGRGETPRGLRAMRSQYSLGDPESRAESSPGFRKSYSSVFGQSASGTKTSSLRPQATPRHPIPSREVQDSHMKRDDSSSSIVTAVRDNSGRSSAAGTQKHQRRHCERT